PLDLDVFRAGDDDERAEGVGQAVLHQERRLVAGEGLARPPELVGPLGGPLADARGRDGVELLARRVVGEGDPRERLAVERAIWIQDGGPEGLDEGAQAAGPGRDDLAGHLVGVDHGDAELAQPRGDSALSRGDAARETEEMHAPRIYLAPPGS